MECQKNMKKCDPLQFTYTGQHFQSALYGFESLPIKSKKCKLKILLFHKKKRWNIGWALVERFGEQNNHETITRHSRKGVENVGSDALKTNDNDRTKEPPNFVRLTYEFAMSTWIRKELFKQYSEKGVMDILSKKSFVSLHLIHVQKLLSYP